METTKVKEEEEADTRIVVVEEWGIWKIRTFVRKESPKQGI